MQISLEQLLDFSKEMNRDLSENVERKFTETCHTSDYEVWSQNGWVDIKRIGKTIPYLKYRIVTDNYEIECADDHILIDSEWDQIFAKDLNKDSRPDGIVTETGIEIVREVINTGEYEEMFDIELEEGSDHLFFTNGILSHNSIWLANDAANFVRLGYNTVYITAEMSAVKVLKRIGSNLLGISMTEYQQKSADRDFIKRKLERISNGILPPGKLFVKEFPTSQVTVPEIENYLKVLEDKQGFKLKAIIIDYINILANYRNPNSDNTYMKIKQIAEDLRAMAVRNNWLVITATQLSRGAWDSSEVTMQNIAESAGLAHTADTMYAIIQDSMMHSAREYWLKVLKIRDGEGKNTKCRFTIDYNYMKLSETSDVIAH